MAQKRSKKVIIIATLLVAILATVLYFYLGSKDNGAIDVKVGKVERRTIILNVSAVGKIQPETEVKISSETSGELIFLGVKEGDTVHKGQILGKIRPDIIETQLEQYKASVDAAKIDIDFSKVSLENAKLEYERTKELFNKNFASKQQFENAKANYDKSETNLQSSIARFTQSQAAYKQIQRSAERTTIYSPIDGILTKLLTEVGEKVLGTQQFQGTELMRVSDLTIMNAVVEVSENEIVHVKVGDTARVEIDAFPNKVFNGLVYEIGHSAKQTAAGTQEEVTNFEVKIRLIDNDAKLRPGMSCNVDMETEISENTLSVPLQAVTIRSIDGMKETDVKEDGIQKESKENTKKIEIPKPVVFVKDKDKAKMKSVEVGISDKGFIEIKSGLSENEEIIIGNYQAVSKDLFDGAKVKLENSETKAKESKNE